jgi:hypothetical protein
VVKGIPEHQKTKAGKKDTAVVEGALSTTTSVTAAAPQEEKTVQVRRCTTNTMMISLGSLAQETSPSSTGPEFCQQCGATVSYLSCLKSSGGVTVWTCEFCGQENNLQHLSSKSVPQTPCTDYLLEPAPTVEGDKAVEGGSAKANGGLVIFAIDRSGSMSCNTKVPDLQAEWASAAGRGATKSISRLEAIKDAVTRHLDHMVLTNPENTVALVTFDSHVCYYGDGSQAMTQLDTGSLYDFNQLMEQGKKFGGELSLRNLQDSLSDMKQCVSRLAYGSTTALGPALALCVGMTSNFSWADIILCTDGKSNQGCGNSSDTNFYTTMGEHARDSHTTVSVLGFEDSQCAVQSLSKCASITSGTVNVLHALEMVRQIRQISQNPIVATKVEVTYLMPPVVRAEGQSDSKVVTKVTEEVGNVTKETDVSLHFSIDGNNLKNIASLPFQVSAAPTVKGM